MLSSKRRSRMNVDVAPFRNFALVYGVAAIIAIIAIIVGATGPSPIASDASYVYKCENNSHVWSSEYCTGKEPDYSKDTITLLSDGMNKLNRFWIVEIMPFNKNWTKGNKNVYKKVAFTVMTNLSYSSSKYGPWTLEGRKNAEHTTTIACPLATKSAVYSGECQGFSIAFEKSIKHKYLKLDFSISFDKAATPEYEIGDIEYTVHKGSSSFGSFEITFMALYTILTAVALVYTVIALLSQSAPCTFEQVCLVVVLVCVLLYDNPLFMVDYAFFSVVFFKVFDSILKSIFISAVLLFWLFITEKLGSGRDTQPSSVVFIHKRHIAKYVVVFVYFVLCVITSSWDGAEEAKNPVSALTPAGLMVVYVLTILVLIGTILWVVVRVVRRINIISDNEVTFKRFFFFILPSTIVAAVMIICSFTGSFGAVVDSPFEVAFFFTVYNVYVWILMYGYLPSSSVKIFFHNDKQPTSENNEFKKVNQSVIYDDDDDENDNDDDDASLSESSAIITPK